MKYIFLTVLAAMTIFHTDQARSQDWVGSYVGGHLGSTSADFDVFIPQSGVAFDSNPSGISGGFFAGYNFQNGNIIWGIESDLTIASGDKAIVVQGTTVNMQHDFSGTIRGRAGVKVADSAFLYGTAGLAFGKFEMNLKGVGLDATESNTSVGYVVGGGLEYMFSPSVFMRAEYLYSDFGTEDYFSNTAGLFTEEVDNTTHDIRVGVGFKF